MPTIIHQDFRKPLCTESDIFEISDGLSGKILHKGDRKIYAKVKLDCNSKNITVHFYDDKSGLIPIDEKLVLNYVIHSHNGLFKYKIVVPDEGCFIIKKNNGGGYQFPCDIYHKIKEFYHIHEHHQADDADSMLKPYISSEDVNIFDCDNKALLHYLQEYEAKFQNNHLFIQLIYNRLVGGGLWMKCKMFLSRNSNHHSFYRMVSRLKGDKAYYNSLFFSCYNKHIRVKDIDLNDDAAKEKRRKAFNVDNIVSNIRTMEERINNKFSLSNSRISFWIAIIAILISIYTYYSSMASSSVSDEHNKYLLEKGYIEIQQKMDDVNSRIEEIYNMVSLKLDSIDSLLKPETTSKQK